MSNTTIQARISQELKDEAEAIFAAIGLKTSDAIRMFLTQSVNDNGLPFRPHSRAPNTKTIKAIQEDHKKLKSHTNPQDAFNELDI